MSERAASNVCSYQFCLLNKFIKLVELLLSFRNCTLQQKNRQREKAQEEEEAGEKNPLQMGNSK